jgi:putative addiction module CopG family antidote
MPIQLTPMAEALIRQKVRSGLYDNAEAAIDAAVQLLDDRDRRVERLRAAIAEGERGEALPWTPELMEQLSREAEDMQRRGEAPDPDVCP